MKIIHKIKGDVHIIIKSIKFVLDMSLEYDKTYLLVACPIILINTISPFIMVIFPKLIIDSVVNNEAINKIILITVTMFLCRAIISIASNVLSNISNRKITKMRFGIMKSLLQKNMQINYSYLEDPKFLDIKDRALECAYDSRYHISGIVGYVSSFISNILTLIGLSYIISTLNFSMILLVLAVVAINSYAKSIQAKKTYFFRNKFSKILRKLQYMRYATRNYKYSKDIKSYNLSEWLGKKKQDYLEMRLKHTIKMIFFSTVISIISIITSTIQELIIYLLLVVRVLQNKLTIGNFTMILTAVNTFTNSLSAVTSAYISLSEASLYISDLIIFKNLPDAYTSTDSDASTDIDLENNFCLEFCNVSFAYPNQDKLVLKDISIKISKNERLSIVGENGAGKTTFVKLIMRFYKPSSGKILLNGIDIEEYDLASYTKLISAVFQDYKIFAFSLKENITIDNYDELKLSNALTNIGLNTKLSSLQQGIETCLSKEFDSDGTEFSGGEQQKIAIAQAIYKDSPLVILDEPTSNLSPMAEYELYQNFNELTQGRTALFISHRLSSCRFSDNIAVFDDGKIVEHGTHEKLLKLDGVYAKMFTTQAQYYTQMS